MTSIITLNQADLYEVSGGNLQPMNDQAMRMSHVPTMFLPAYIAHHTHVSYTNNNPFDTGMHAIAGAAIGAGAAIAVGQRDPRIIGIGAGAGALQAVRPHFTFSWTGRW